MFMNKFGVVYMKYFCDSKSVIKNNICNKNNKVEYIKNLSNFYLAT